MMCAGATLYTVQEWQQNGRLMSSARSELKFQSDDSDLIQPKIDGKSGTTGCKLNNLPP